ncbi:hypothetical protein FTUN_2228 [Frigoriglobus tundricola]|uniref:Uncharacterized protein n=1 Tax=Frigoriglobus tundricola TaxID=2774151 RepID=A0A6M5YMY3_9BACT|nr:hypothetical protein FTUN_2228 [Frigoriglobus tundricola]
MLFGLAESRWVVNLLPILWQMLTRAGSYTGYSKSSGLVSRSEMHMLALFADGAPVWVAIVGPFIGVAATLLLAYLKRTRGQYVVATEIASSSLVGVAKTIRHRISVRLDDEPVQDLSQIELRVTNTGLSALRDIRITLDFGSSTKVLDCEITPNELAIRTIPAPHHTVELVIPSLNSEPLHREALTLKIVCDGPTRNFEIRGRGDGWTVRKTSQIESIRMTNRLIQYGSIALSITASILTIIYMEEHGIGRNEWSWRVFWAMLPLMIFFVAHMLTLRWLLRRSLRTWRSPF